MSTIQSREEFHAALARERAAKAEKKVSDAIIEKATKRTVVGAAVSKTEKDADRYRTVKAIKEAFEAAGIQVKDGAVKGEILVKGQSVDLKVKVTTTKDRQFTD